MDFKIDFATEVAAPKWWQLFQYGEIFLTDRAIYIVSFRTKNIL